MSKDALEQCQTFLAAIFEPDDIIEFRCLKPERQQWGTLADLPGIIETLTKLNASGAQVYFGANPRKADGGSKEQDVAFARCLFADFDHKTTVAEALARIKAVGLPMPTAIITSGGGVHCYWLLTEPVTDARQWNRLQKTLAESLPSDAAGTSGFPRIMRLPGFVNHKYADKPVAAVVEVDAGRVYTLNALTPKTKPIGKATRAFIDNGDIGESGGRREAMFAAACDLRDRGWTPGAAEAALMPRMQSFDLSPDDLADCPRQIRNAWNRPPRTAIVEDTLSPTEPPSDPVPEWQPFPVELLPSPLREFVQESVASMSADPVAFVLPLLSATAAAIGTSRRIELWNGWTEPAVLWTAMVAESGSMKSPPFKSATSQTMARHKDTLTEHAAAMRHWEQEKREYDRASRRQNGGDIGEPPEKPVAERVLVDDLTIESLAPILAGNPVGVLLAKEELSGWFDFDRYTGGKGGGEAARWLSCYDASSLTVDRKGGGTIFVPSAAVSIAGTIQPRTLVRVVGSKHLDNGLFQRFMVAMPPKMKKSIPKGGLSFTTTESMRQLFDTLFAIRPAEDGTPKVIDFDAEAAALWADFYNAHADAQHEATGVVASMLAKAEAWAARLTLVFHMVNQAHAAAGDRVTADTLAAGIAVARWAAHEWERVLRIMESGAVEADDAGLLAIVQKHGGVMTVRDLARVGPAAYRAPGAAEAGLRRLVKSGRAAWQAEATGGRPADAIRLV